MSPIGCFDAFAIDDRVYSINLEDWLVCQIDN